MRTSRLFIAFSFLFISALSFGQESKTSEKWITLQNVDGIKVEYRKGECNVPAKGSYTEEVYLRFTNTTGKLVNVKWSYDATYGTACFNCDGNNEEMQQILKLEPNSSREGQCGDDNDLRLRIFSTFLKMENPTPLNDFHVKILSVTELKVE